MIDERLEEQTALYALGMLEGAEKLAFETALQRDSELQRLAAELTAAAASFAGMVPAVNPPSGLKEKILSRLDASTAAERIIPLPASHARTKAPAAWVPWTLAACFAILCVTLASRENVLQDQIRKANGLAASLQGMTNQMTADLALLQETNRAATEHIQRLNELAETLEHATNDLRQAIVALQETNRVASLRIAFLGSLLSDQPRTVAVSLWDDKNQSGVFVVENLKPVPKNKDYQLWVIDPQYKTPVDAGVFQVDDKGRVRFQFKAKARIGVADKFAVTEEDKGGSPVPKGQMVLIGG